jgi:hypothetical protein
MTARFPRINEKRAVIDRAYSGEEGKAAFLRWATAPFQGVDRRVLNEHGFLTVKRLDGFLEIEEVLK